MTKKNVQQVYEGRLQVLETANSKFHFLFLILYSKVKVVLMFTMFQSWRALSKSSITISETDINFNLVYFLLCVLLYVSKKITQLTNYLIQVYIFTQHIKYNLLTGKVI